MTYRACLLRKATLEREIEDLFWSIPSRVGTAFSLELKEKMKEHSAIVQKIDLLRNGVKPTENLPNANEPF